MENTVEVQELKYIRNFKIKIPDDCFQILQITTVPKQKTAKIITETIENNSINGYKTIQSLEIYMFVPSFLQGQYMNMAPRKNTFKIYSIQKDEIFFFGKYSNFFILKWIQKLIDYIYPEKVIIKYLVKK